MTPGDALMGVALGLVFFVGHLAITVAKVRSSETPELRLEALGFLMRGLPGLMIALAIAVRSSRLVSLLLAIASVPTLILGRAVYELVVFRGRPDR